jgi:hypothetical protein
LEENRERKRKGQREKRERKIADKFATTKDHKQKIINMKENFHGLNKYVKIREDEAGLQEQGR